MPTVKSSALTTHQWEELTNIQLDSSQLDKMEAQLDLLFFALEALAEIKTDSILQAATYLNLEPRLPDHMWQQTLSPDRNQVKRPIDVEAARSLVLIVCYLAKQHQELIRRAITLLEQQAANHRPPNEVALLEDYLNRFNQLYSQHWSENPNSIVLLNSMALKLLVELLFYSGPFGHRRLWLVLLNR